MTSEKARRSRVTVYRLQIGESLEGLVRAKYLDRDEFTTEVVQVGEISGQLILGRIQTERVKWTDHLGSISGTEIEASNQTAAAVLLLPLDDAVYALTFGMGHLLINYGDVDPGFGLRYAARVLDAEQLRSITRHTLDKRAQIDRCSIPSGGDVRAFGISDLGAVASRVNGRTKQTEERTAATVRGADALNLPLSRTPDELIHDLREIDTTLNRPIDDPDLELLTRITPIQPRDPRRKLLDQRLTEALLSDGDAPLGTAWPWEQADELSVFESMTLSAPNQEPRLMDWISVDDLKGLVRETPKKDPIAVLKKAKVILFSDEEGQEIASPAISAVKWIAFETRINDTLCFFHDGRWFSMDGSYSESIRRETESILSQPCTLTLTPWRRNGDYWEEEKDYNDAVADNDNRFLVLDRKLVRTKVHPRGIEVCDLLGPNDEFVHVKRFRKGSTDASHLFAQALVATDSMMLDGEAQLKFAKRVGELSKNSRTPPERPRAIVLAIAGRGPLSTRNLFTFSQVTLVRLVQNLNARGVSVQVTSIPDIQDPSLVIPPKKPGKP